MGVEEDPFAQGGGGAAGSLDWLEDEEPDLLQDEFPVQDAATYFPRPFPTAHLDGERLYTIPALLDVAHPRDSVNNGGTNVHTWLLPSEVQWLRQMFGWDPPLAGPTAVAQGHGMTDVQSLPRPPAVREAWDQMISPQALANLVEHAPIYQSGVLATGGGPPLMPVLRFTYDLKQQHLPGGAVFLSSSSPARDIVGAAAADIHRPITLYRTITADIVDRIRTFAMLETRRRRYATTVTSVGANLTDGDDTSFADFYDANVEGLDNGGSVPPMWPTNVVVEMKEVPHHQTAPTTAGAFFPYYWHWCNKTTALQEMFGLWLGPLLGVYRSPDDLQSRNDNATILTALLSRGCFWHALATSMRYSMDHFTAAETRMLYQSCWRVTTLARTDAMPNGDGALDRQSTGYGVLPRVSTHADGYSAALRYLEVNLRKARRIIEHWNEQCLALRSATQRSSYLPISVVIMYCRDFSKANRHKTYSVTYGEPGGRVLRIGCLAGHYFTDQTLLTHPLFASSGIARFGFRRLLHSILNGASDTVIDAHFKNWDHHSIRGYARRQAVLTPFQLVREMLLMSQEVEYADSVPSNLLIPLTRHADVAPFVECTDLSAAWAQQPRTEFLTQPAAFSTYPAELISSMVKIMEAPKPRADGTQWDFWNPVEGRFAFVMDTEDTPDTHRLYLLASHVVTPPGVEVDEPSVSFFHGSKCAEPRLHWFRDYAVPATRRWAEDVLRRHDPPIALFPRHFRLLIFCHNLIYDFHHILRELRSCPVEAQLTWRNYAVTFREDGLLMKDNRIIRAELMITWMNAQGTRHRYELEFRDSWRLLGGMSVASMPQAFGFANSDIRKELFLHDWMVEKSPTADTAYPFPQSLLDAYPEATAQIPLSELRQRAEWFYTAYAETTAMRSFPFHEFEEASQDFQNLEGTAIAFWDYAAFYCKQDCRVVAEALIRFHCMGLDLPTPFPSLSALSASSLADAVMQEAGGYVGVAMLNGDLERFFANFICGGRCQVAHNRRCLSSVRGEPILDLDAVSLYPSAFRQLTTEFGGLCAGVPVPFSDDDYATMDDLLADGAFQGFFVITDPLDGRCPPPIPYSLGLYCWKPMRDGEGKGGSLQWVNDLRELEGTPDRQHALPFTNGLFFDAVSFRDYLEHQPHYCARQFRIRCGYGFPQPRNPTIATTIERIYQLRRDSQDPAKKQLYKLILNGCYGKTLQRPTCVAKKVTCTDQDWRRRLALSYNQIIGMTPVLPDVPQLMLIDMLKPFAESFSRPQVGAEVLSMARRLMNRVVCCFPPPRSGPPQPHAAWLDTRFPIGGVVEPGQGFFYTDTDSLHVYERDWEEIILPKLAQRYPGVVFVGSELGQFHSDFACPFPTISTDSIRGVYGCFVNKKIYGYVLQGEDRTSHQLQTWQVGTMKGITKDALRLLSRQRASEAEGVVDTIFEPLARNPDSASFVFNLAATSSGGAARPSFGLIPHCSGLGMTNRPPVSRRIQA